MKLAKMLLLPLLVVPAALCAQTSTAPHNATVRGLLESFISKSKQTSSAPGILVTVENSSYTSPAVKSGKDGLYYIPNVPAGSYMLKVWADPHKPLIFPITIKPQLTDIPPVLVMLENAAPSHAQAPNTKSKASTQNTRTHSGSKN